MTALSLVPVVRQVKIAAKAGSYGLIPERRLEGDVQAADPRSSRSSLTVIRVGSTRWRQMWRSGRADICALSHVSGQIRDRGRARPLEPSSGQGSSRGVQPLAVPGFGCNHHAMSPAGSGRAQFHSRLSARVGHHADRFNSHHQQTRWLISAWLVGLGLVVVSGLLPSAVGYVVILGSCVFLGAVGAPSGDPSGLRDYRQ